MIALVDCNNFYASCERLFRPDLEKKPIVVLSNNDGCIISRSAEAKQLGIPMGAAAYQWVDTFEKKQVHVFSSNYALYGDMSQRVMNILSSAVPETEVYSIDEAFLCLDGIDNPQKLALELVQRVKKWVGIPISIGIGTTKTLAKVATQIAKKFPELKQVHLIDSEEKRMKALKWLPVGNVWGVGRRSLTKMNYHGIETAFDLTQKSDSFIRKHFSVVGLRTKKELETERCFEFENQPSAKKSIATTRSFAERQHERSLIEEAVFHYTGLCACKLRKQKLCASTLMVFLATNRFENSAQYNGSFAITFPTPTNNSAEMVKFAKSIMQLIFKDGFYYKRAGVVVSGLIPEDHVQLSIFDQVDRPKYRRLYKVLDHLNESYGQETITLASSKGSRKWKLKQEKRSNHYTTRWDDLLKIELNPNKTSK